MKLYTLETEQLVSADMPTVWDFFSDPRNLQKITPSELGFHIKTKFLKNEMYPGQMIEYTVKPLLGIPLTWLTEITVCEKYKLFVDEQRVGPYAIWHHEHHFIEVKEGIKLIDRVTYAIPFGILGQMAHPVVVQPKLKKIFAHREQVVNQMFNKK